MSDSPSKTEKRLRAAIAAAYKAELRPDERAFIGSAAHANVQRAERALVEHWLDQGEAVSIIAAVDKEHGEAKATPEQWAAATKRAHAEHGDATDMHDIVWHLSNTGGATPGHPDAITLREAIARTHSERTLQ